VGVISYFLAVYSTFIKHPPEKKSGDRVIG